MLLVLFTAKLGIAIGDFNVQLSCSFNDGLAFSGRDTVCNLSCISSIGHHQNFQFLAKTLHHFNIMVEVVTGKRHQPEIDMHRSSDTEDCRLVEGAY